MVDAIAFQTRARTIDHLGREQIADCPTAISELWKNAYDAYAREVALHIFDGPQPIATLTDDGHGMSRDEFVEKWLVVGTESKATNIGSTDEDRDGLPIRQKQGQKGIGRLSSAALGPLLLLVSKRKTTNYVAALIDWRLFENPFLYLHDIELPVVEFESKDQLFSLLPDMFDKLMSNIWGSGKDQIRDTRIAESWKKFDAINSQDGRLSTREAIESVIINTTFSERHIEQWNVWNGKSQSGTALLVADISFDLEAHIPACIDSSDQQTAQLATDRLFQTLSNFTDPFVDANSSGTDYAAPEFVYSVIAWEGALSRAVISNERSFGYQNLEDLEHLVEGTIDNAGVFVGRIKAFGKWLDGEITLIPKAAVPSRSDSKVGPFHLRIGTFEQVPVNSTHPAEIHSKLLHQASIYAGFMVYRNGLRVMPYGREDNDFFEIEKRRNLHAGREFWSYRRIFGRVALTREENQNLKDKAGREGIIDNKAAKVFRDLVENILMVTARRYFGYDSPVRKELLPEVNALREKERAEEAQKKLRTRKRKEFRLNLKKYLLPIQELKEILEEIAESARANTLPTEESELIALREKLSVLKLSRSEMTLGPAPTNLGVIEEDYRIYRACSIRSNELIVQLNDTLAVALQKAKPQSQRDLAYSQLARNANFLQNRLRKWSAEAKLLLNTELTRVSELTEERNKKYHATTLSLLDDLENSRLSISAVLNQLDAEKDAQDTANAEVFEAYISTLRSMEESIDLETLVNVVMAETDDARSQIGRLNSLAQLGITVEIVGHEIEGFETSIARGLREMPPLVKDSEAYKAIKIAHEGLSERLKFLSPLKLSGEKSNSWISGQQIFDYVSKFLGKSLQGNGVTISQSPEFSHFSIYEQPARIFPIFINLISNSVYWVGQGANNKRQILLDIVDEKVIVADDGPGVEVDDISQLFSLFFTRKVRGGRGVGLYLCRANLAAGGHVISYATDPKYKKLVGANFAISFKGAKYE